MATHRQTWVKVNAPLAEGVAEIVSVLNTMMEAMQRLPRRSRRAGTQCVFVRWRLAADVSIRV